MKHTFSCGVAERPATTLVVCHVLWIRAFCPRDYGQLCRLDKTDTRWKGHIALEEKWCILFGNHRPSGGPWERLSYLCPGSWHHCHCMRSLVCWSSLGGPWSAAGWKCRAEWCPRPPPDCWSGWSAHRSWSQASICRAQRERTEEGEAGGTWELSSAVLFLWAETSARNGASSWGKKPTWTPERNVLGGRCGHSGFTVVFLGWLVYKWKLSWRLTELFLKINYSFSVHPKC